MSSNRRSASYFAQISRRLLAQPDERTTRERVVQYAVDAIPGADAGSLVLTDRHGCHETVVAAPEWVVAPAGSLSSLHDAPAATARGLTDVLPVRLGTDDEAVGTLTLYARTAAFTAGDAHLAGVYAAHASNALIAARRAAELRTAVESRHELGVAQGILMQSRGLGLEESLDLMHRYAELHGISLAALAGHVVTHATLPGETDGVQ